MTVLQPHYITAGRYTPKVDRKIFAGIFDTTSGGAIMTGVLPPTNHFEVTGSGLTVSVSPGFAVIADASSQSTDSPGVYLCTIDANPETLTLAGTGTYQIYAEASEAQFAITVRTILSNVATITTGTTNHGFLVGQTVLVSGVDSTFDGSYVITGKTNTTFSYAKIAGDQTVTANLGFASVPFAIKSSSSTVPVGINYILLAEVSVPASAITSVNDKRKFVTSRGGVQLYRSTPVAGTYTATSAETGPGRLSYDLSTGNLKYYNAYNSTTVPIVYASTGHHDSAGTSTAGSIHHNIGTGQYDAAAGNHTHAKSPTNINSPSVISDTATSFTISSNDSASPSTITGAAITYNYASGFTGNLVGLVTGTVTVEWTSNDTYFVNQTIVYVGISTSSAGTSDDVAFSGLSSASNVVGKGTTATTGVLSTNRITIPFTRVVDFNQTGAHTITLKAHRNNTDNVVKVVQYNMAFVPIRAY